MNILEKTKRYEIGAYVIRIWTEGILPSDYEVSSLVRLFLSSQQIAIGICGQYNCNAVECVDGLGEGYVYYKEWP